MPLVQCKCTNCGANLQVDNTKDAAICEFCGSAFIVEKAINNYNVTNNITAGVVNVYGGNSADFVIRAGVLEKYTGAATDVVIPNSVTRITGYAFAYCEGMTSVIIPNSVTSIGRYAFEGCTGLTSITIPDSVTSIENAAFEGCTGLTSIVIPDSVTSIGERAFEGCTGLTSITIPDSVTSIEDWTFYRCYKLKTVICSEEWAKKFGSHFPEGSTAREVYLQEKERRKQEEAQKKKSGGCYIATAVYGSYDCRPVWTLRRYRDDTLAATRRGRTFIRAYYAISPTLVKWFGHTAWFQKLWRGRLDKLVARLNGQGVEDTPYQDRNW